MVTGHSMPFNTYSANDSCGADSRDPVAVAVDIYAAPGETHNSPPWRR
ncbi:hypothetical protein ST4_093 [Aeromonas phage ST4]|nr:hypothetical protein ST4_093 [Aeromonas phage ST4]